MPFRLLLRTSWQRTAPPASPATHPRSATRGPAPGCVAAEDTAASAAEAIRPVPSAQAPVRLDPLLGCGMVLLTSGAPRPGGTTGPPARPPSGGPCYRLDPMGSTPGGRLTSP